MVWTGARVEATVVVVPAQATDAERRAAGELQRIWGRGSVVAATLRREDDADPSGESGPWFFVGETKLARAEASLPAGTDRDGFRVKVVRGGRVVLRGATPDANFLAVCWFAQQQMGARWFGPGELGEVIPALAGWRPKTVDQVVAPAFLSRGFAGLNAEGQAWAERNGLHDRLPHSHAMTRLFGAQDFDAHPDWFPWRDGRRYRPTSVNDYNWQPNLVLPEVAARAADQAVTFFAANPMAEGFSISINDSIRFDQAAATLAARGPLRWFRGRPVYSDVVFGFTNRVADLVAERFPEKLIGAYAYYWGEQTPSFAVRKNVVPWLTAERDLGYDPEFAKEDRELIAHWMKSGAKVVGLYDYVYGAPFLVPRVTAKRTAQSIVDAYGAGVRAYTAEAYPQWGLDGPKLWLAAQMLWNPAQRSEALLADYYERYWQDAARPMRAFYERCEKAWDEQPRPAWWLKFYYDEAQARLFPKELRMELRAHLDAAKAAARDAAVQARVAQVSEAFAVSEAFCDFNEAREALAGLAASGNEPAEVAVEGIARLMAGKAAFRARYAQAVERRSVDAVKEVEIYWRNDPSQQVAEWALQAGGESVRERLGKLAGGDDGKGLRAVLAADLPRFSAVERFDGSWQRLALPDRWDDTTFVWQSGAWRGTGEPAEKRSIVLDQADPTQPRLIFRGCKTDSISQWVPVSRPDLLYRARIELRGRFGVGSQTYLVLSWLDRAQRYVGEAVSARVPLGAHVEPVRLAVFGQAPKDAAYVGVALYVRNQMPEDRLEAGVLSLDAGPSR